MSCGALPSDARSLAGVQAYPAAGGEREQACTTDPTKSEALAAYKDSTLPVGHKFGSVCATGGCVTHPSCLLCRGAK